MDFFVLYQITTVTPQGADKLKIIITVSGAHHNSQRTRLIGLAVSR